MQKACANTWFHLQIHNGMIYQYKIQSYCKFFKNTRVMSKELWTGVMSKLHNTSWCLFGLLNTTWCWIQISEQQILNYWRLFLPRIGSLFFVFNQQNYSRYLVRYNNLLQTEKTHPGLKLQLQKGSFGIRRTDKPYSRQPIDLTLEQMINVDAANKLTGTVYSFININRILEFENVITNN